MEGRELGRASAEGANRFTVEIEPEHLGVYLLEMKEN
jgi:hypothetical protein